MTYEPAKLCASPRCKTWVRGTTYCPAHQGRAKAGEVKRLEGRALQTFRQRYLRDHPLCAECERKGRLGAAQEVDHVVRLVDGGTYDDSNLQALCRPAMRPRPSWRAGAFASAAAM